VQKDGTLVNGAFALREAYTAIRKGGAAIAQFGGTERASVFLAEMPGYRVKETKDVAGIAVTVSGVNNGQAIAIRPSDRELLVVGFRCTVSVRTGDRTVKAERGAWIGAEWRSGGPVRADVDVDSGEMRFRLAEPQAVRLYW
jgi:hypothetical protein